MVVMVVVVGNTDNEDSKSVVLLCLCHVSSVLTDPPHWNGSISELRGASDLTTIVRLPKPHPRCLHGPFLHVEEAGSRGHS